MYRPLLDSDTNTAVKYFLQYIYYIYLFYLLGFRRVVEIYNTYKLIRDDTEAINELGAWPNRKDIAQSIASKAKSALTRALNKEHRMLPYAQPNAVVKGRKKGSAIAEKGMIFLV